MDLKKLFNLDSLTRNNNEYRKSLYRTKNMEFVLMSIPVNGNVPLENHKNEDQFIRVEQGNAKILIGKENKNEYNLKVNDAVIIPEGKWHEIINVGNEELKIYVIYAPSEKMPNNNDENISIFFKTIFIILILIFYLKYYK
jgi:mannose-6-phosphate isomerase-like protein (cupin superfamily)